jgi:hypothetical protein
MYETITEIQKANEAINHRFFENTWYTQVADQTVYAGKYFITKESLKIGSVIVPESFTIREVLPSGAIGTVGKAGEYETLEKAQVKIKKIGA